MKETVTDFETVEREREVVVCDVCGQREEDDEATVEVAFGATVDLPSSHYLTDDLMHHSVETSVPVEGSAVRTGVGPYTVGEVEHRLVPIGAVERTVDQHLNQVHVEADATRDVCRRCLTIFEASDAGDSDRITVNEATRDTVERLPEATGSSSLSFDANARVTILVTMLWVGLLTASILDVLPFAVVLPIASFLFGFSGALAFSS